MRHTIGILASVLVLLWACASGCKSSFPVGVDGTGASTGGEDPGSGGDGGAGGSNLGTGGIGVVIVQWLDLDGGAAGGADGGAVGGGQGDDDGGVGGGADGWVDGGALGSSAFLCTGAPNSEQFKYAQGYTPDPNVLNQVANALSTMSLSDKATQMRGMPFGSVGSPQLNDLQRSRDTASIRGFRYRDGTRGMNLAEDMDGAVPNAGKVNGTTVGYSTAFPVGVARGASFDLDLEYAVGEAIGDEMQAAKQTVLSAPCVDLLRHPLWGRAQESYGEDPFHVGRLASAMTVGIQQHVAAVAVHVAAYGIENGRTFNNSALDEQTLREIYGRDLRMVIQDAGVAGMMAAYNLVNGIKSTTNRHVLTDILRNDFGFKGFVQSDWWAMLPETNVAGTDSTTLKRNAMDGVLAGLDIELPWALNYGQLEALVNASVGLTQFDIDQSVTRILTQKFRFKAQDMKGNVGLGKPVTTYAKGRISNNQNHIDLANRAALESMVLLKNADHTLPIQRSVTKVAVLGATVPVKTWNDGRDTNSVLNFATDTNTGDMGSSRVFHDPALGIGPFAGIRKTAPDGVTVVTGSSAADAADADFIVVVAGLTAEDEGEEYTTAGDRPSLALDAKQSSPYQNLQNNLITAAATLGKPMVVVLEGGSAIDMPWLSQVPAVVMAWYPGMVGGEALGHLLWGDSSFGGKLPFTWPKQLSDLPELNGNGTTVFDYDIGYRYYDKHDLAPLFPFGHGLSYTSFEYRKLELPCGNVQATSAFPVKVTLANTGSVDADEVVMVFVSYPNTRARRPAKELKGFARVRAQAGQEVTATVYVRAADLDYFDQDGTGSWVIEADTLQVRVGSSGANLPLSGTVTVVH